MIKALSTVLLIKILFTLIFWCIPLLFFPSSLFIRIGIPEPQPILFIRLLGLAYLALTLGYILGFKALRQNRNVQSNDVRNVVLVGLVSNGSASMILFISGSLGVWSEWSNLAQIFMWSSAIVTAFITLGLFLTGWYNKSSRMSKA
jgi:cation transport ATPase